jgi:hypothetical protein
MSAGRKAWLSSGHRKRRPESFIGGAARLTFKTAMGIIEDQPVAVISRKGVLREGI